MPRWKILVSAPYFQPVIDQYRGRFAEYDCELVVPEVHERLSEKELLALIVDIDGVICGDDQFTKRVLDNAPKLKVLSKWGTGIDSIDQEAAQIRQIAVRNTPNAFSDPVADSAMGYLLCFARGLVTMDRRMKAGLWDKPPGRALNESCLGIIGLGNIGQAMARRAKGFGLRVLAADIRVIDGAIASEFDIELVDHDRVLAEADFLSLHCDLNPTSHHIIADRALSKMKSTAVVINTARGSLIKESSLIRALENQTIAGAALDVFEDEPLPAISKLLKFENVMTAAHNSNSSPRAWQRVHDSTLKNLFEVLVERSPR